MCTVTFLPTPSGFILTHNRDEAPSRSPEVISRVQEGGDTLLFPRDTKAGGAWVAASKSGRTACLLNGAFVKHHHNPPYRRSRGLVLLDFFHWPQPDLFFGQYDLDGIEPFTFLYFNTDRVVELRWDGTQRYVKELAPDEPHFWCSATLYPPDMQQKRKQVFLDWLQQTVHRLPSSVHRLPSTVLRLSPASDRQRWRPRKRFCHEPGRSGMHGEYHANNFNIKKIQHALCRPVGRESGYTVYVDEQAVRNQMSTDI